MAIDGAEDPERPGRIERIGFEDVVMGWPSPKERHVVPLAHARPGDRQVGLFWSHDWTEPMSLDPVAALPDVESIYATGPVVLRRSLPHGRELLATHVDAESLANLPGLCTLSVGYRQPVDVADVPAGVVDLAVSVRSVGSVEAVASLTRLERLRSTARTARRSRRWPR